MTIWYNAPCLFKAQMENGACLLTFYCKADDNPLRHLCRKRKKNQYHHTSVRDVVVSCVPGEDLVCHQSRLGSAPNLQDGHTRLGWSAAAARIRGCTDASLYLYLRKKKKYGGKWNGNGQEYIKACYNFKRWPGFWCWFLGASVTVVYWHLSEIPRQLGHRGANSLWQWSLYDRSSWPDICWT